MVQHIILYLSINNNTNFKLTITKLHFTIAQIYFQTFLQANQELSSQLSFNSVPLLLALCIHCAWDASYMGLHIYRQWLWTQAHSNHAVSWNHQVMAHVLVTYYEDLLVTLLDVRSTRSKLPPLELIQLAPNCALDKALSEHVRSIQLQDGEDLQDTVFLQPQEKVWSKWSKSIRLFLKQTLRPSNPAPKLLHSEILETLNNAI